MEKVNIIEANSLVRLGGPIDGEYWSPYNPEHIVCQDEGFRYILVIWRFTWK